MNIRNRERRVVLVLLATVALLSAGLTGASAQELPGGNETTAPERTAIYDQLGDLVVHSYSYEDGEMTLEVSWRGTTPETVTITEMVALDSGGSQRISFKKIRLLPDERTEITVSARMKDGTAAVLLTTPQSVERSEALLVQHGAGSFDPFAGTTSSAGWIGGVSVAVSMIGLAAVRAKRNDPEGPEEVE
jgi:hypothetical protein